MITLPRNPLKGTGRPDPASASRRRFARRQWLRRWLVWRYVIGSVLLVALAAGAIWLVFISSFLTVQQVQVQGGDALLTRQQILAAADVPDGAHLVELDLGRDPRAGRGTGARTSGRRLARLAARRPDQGDRAHPRRRGRDRRPFPCHGRRGRPVPRLPPTTGRHAARGLDRGHQQRRARRGRPRDRGPALGPGGTRRPRRRRGRRPGLAGDARRCPGRSGGATPSPRSRPRCCSSCSPGRATPTTSVSPASRSPAPVELGPLRVALKLAHRIGDPPGVRDDPTPRSTAEGQLTTNPGRRACLPGLGRPECLTSSPTRG